MRKILTIAILLIFVFTQSCKNKDNPNNNNTPAATASKPVEQSVLKLNSPQNAENYTINDTVKIDYSLLTDTLKIDSTVISINGKKQHAFVGLSHTLPLKESKMGVQRVMLTAFYSGKQMGTLSFTYTVKPKNEPKLFTYRIVKEYPHLTDAYTQGLYFENGFLYEGTGEYGKSSLRKVELETGKVLKSIDLDSKYFGEGICLFNERIYQLTWTSRIGFIYNAETFEKVGEFNYTTEGWGITTDGTHLIMSDGSANLYFINPSNMSVVNQIEAWSYAGSVAYLNELEYINGEIWANIYGDNSIARINPETGEVTGLINLQGILKQTDYTRETDVLNGIAYDEQNKRIFVTGKRWPKLFEIKVVEK